jgi:hypothetical protein
MHNCAQGRPAGAGGAVDAAFVLSCWSNSIDSLSCLLVHWLIQCLPFLSTAAEIMTTATAALQRCTPQLIAATVAPRAAK